MPLWCALTAVHSRPPPLVRAAASVPVLNEEAMLAQTGIRFV